MSQRLLILIVASPTLFGMLIVAANPAAAQASLPPDLTGVYVSLPPGGMNFGEDLSSKLIPGNEIILTPYGAERYKKVDMGPGDPGARCLPPGPLRALWGIPYPFVILQHPHMVIIAFEFSGSYRLIHTDGRDHPADVHELPQFMGHSIGKWEGETLVVDTVAVDERLWLDPHGYEHSDKLHLIERFQKTGPNTIKWDLTIEDPVFFVKPFTVTRTFERPRNDRMLMYWCSENEKDLQYMQPMYGGIGRPKVMDRNGNVTQFEPTNRP